mmetsp:Transcript_23531/g.43972  ORF Transcript_23531/g.43972 Transcript_23531/m.43972 type:complete len:239 (+) Transcript_23531:371-1087(+)
MDGVRGLAKSLARELRVVQAAHPLFHLAFGEHGISVGYQAWSRILDGDFSPYAPAQGGSPLNSEIKDRSPVRMLGHARHESVLKDTVVFWVGGVDDKNLAHSLRRVGWRVEAGWAIDTSGALVVHVSIQTPVFFEHQASEDVSALDRVGIRIVDRKEIREVLGEKTPDVAVIPEHVQPVRVASPPGSAPFAVMRSHSRHIARWPGLVDDLWDTGRKHWQLSHIPEFFELRGRRQLGAP